MTMVRSLKSLNSQSPAGALEWKHHMRRHVTLKMSKASKMHHLQLGRRLTKSSSSRAATGTRRCSERIVDSAGFEMASCILILTNVVFVGVELAMWDGTAPAIGEFECLNFAFQSFFLVAFSVEVLFRILAKRWGYFCGQEWKCNVFDVLLLIYSVVDWVTPSTVMTPVYIMRTLRLPRVVRGLRSVHVFRDLRLMTVSLTQSVVPLFSALILLSVVIYLFGVCFTHAAKNYVGQFGLASAGIIDNYGSLSKTMYTLLLAISGGADWEQLAAPLGQIGFGYQALFVFYVMFVVMGVLNVLTSTFVERVRELSKLDRALATQAEIRSQEAFLAEMRTIFEEVDDEHHGRVTWEKFKKYLENEKAQAFFATQQLDTAEAARLFNLLESDELGAVKMEEFALGCMRLRGPAKSSDMQALMKEMKVQRKSAKDLRRIDAKLDMLCGFLQISDVHCCGSAVASPRRGSRRHATLAT
jgi:large-conductance mechanosensitive channel